MDKALQKLAPPQPHLWFYLPKATTSVQWLPDHILFHSSLPLQFWWSSWMWLSYHTQNSTDCYFSTFHITMRFWPCAGQERSGGAQCFLLPHTKPNLQQLSKYSFSDSKGGPHLHTTKNGAKERISREGCQLKKGLEALIKTLQVHISYPNALRPDVFGIQNFWHFRKVKCTFCSQWSVGEHSGRKHSDTSAGELTNNHAKGEKWVEYINSFVQVRSRHRRGYESFQSILSKFWN